MPQDENRADWVNRDSQLKMTLPPSQKKLVSFPLMVKSMPSNSKSSSQPVPKPTSSMVTGQSMSGFVGYKSLLRNHNSWKIEGAGDDQVARKKFRSSIPKSNFSLLSHPSPLAPLGRRTTLKTPGVPRTQLPPEQPCRFLATEKPTLNFSPGNGPMTHLPSLSSKTPKMQSHMGILQPSKNRYDEISTNSSSRTKTECEDDDDIYIIESQSTRQLQNVRRPTILNNSVKYNQTQSAEELSNGKLHSKTVPSAPVVTERKPRANGRKQQLATLPLCSYDLYKTGSKNLSKPDYGGLSQMSRKRPYAAASYSQDIPSQNVEGECSSPKKPKVTGIPTSPVSEGTQKSGGMTPEKSQDKVLTIVLDSSEDESIVVKRPPAKPRAACNVVPSKRKSSGRSVRNANVSRTPLPPRKITPGRNGSGNRNSTNFRRFYSDTESEELSEPEVTASRYVSRTGRSVGIFTACRSCPGCTLDRPRKGKPKPMPVKKKRVPVLMPLTPAEKRPARYASVDIAPTYLSSSQHSYEDTCQTPESPITVALHGLTSSDSSDEEIRGMLDENRTALVVETNDGGECVDSSPESEVEGDISRSPDRQSLSHDNPVEVECEGLNHVGPDDYLPASISASSDSTPHTELCLSATNNTSQISENPYNPAKGAVSSELPMNTGIVDNGVSGSETLVSSPPVETQNRSNVGVVDPEMDGSPNSPCTADVDCYLSQHDTDDVILTEINSDPCEHGNIPSENAKPESEHNEKLGDEVSAPFLADDSSETSGSSLANTNLDFHAYSECEFTCSFPNNSVPIDPDHANEGVTCNANCNSEDSRAEASLGHHLHLDSLDQLHEGELHPERKETFFEGQYQNALNSPKCVPEHSCGGETDRAVGENGVDGGSTLLDDLVSNNGSVLQSDTSDTLLGGFAAQVGLRGTAGAHCSESCLPAVQEGVTYNKYQDVNNDSASSDLSASQEKTSVGEGEPFPILQEVTDLMPVPREDPMSVDRGCSTIDDIKAPVTGVGFPDESLQDVFTEVVLPETSHSRGDDSASPLIMPKSLNILFDASGESVSTESGTKHQLKICEKNHEGQACPFEATNKVIEIHLLEGCPSCLGEGNEKRSATAGCRKQNITDNPDFRGNPVDNQVSECSLPVDSPVSIVAPAQQGTFYNAISNLLIECLNSVAVESVMLHGREVVIKKVNPETAYNALDVSHSDEATGTVGDDLASILQKLDIRVSVNPRLTILKLPSVPREETLGEVHSASLASKTQESNDRQVPETSCSPDITPKSLYKRKGCPTPIKRLDPRVLSVIKYNELEIFNDEPSPNDPPELDRVVCVSSKGIRLELNTADLANLENVLYTKISHVQENDVSFSLQDKANFEIDELVIYSDEPPLNSYPVKRPESSPPSVDFEDLEDLLIDNDAPPLNEPEDAPHQNELQQAKPDNESHDPDCMVISSDDEWVTSLEQPKSQPEVVSMCVTAPLQSCKPLPRPRKKISRKRCNFTPKEAPSVVELQISQLALKAVDSHDSRASSQKIWDLGELESSGNVIDEVVIDEDDLETLCQPALNGFAVQSCREVLHQPQVFNHLGQPLPRLQLGCSVDSDPTAGSSSSSDYAAASSQVTFDLSETFKNSVETECMNISDSDTLTASEYEDEVVMVSSPEAPSSTRVNRFVGMYNNGCDSNAVVQYVDTDSEDDVIVMSGPSKVLPGSRSHPIRSVPSRVHLPLAQERRMGLPHASMSHRTYQYVAPQLPPSTKQVRAIPTVNGDSYYVLLVPPSLRPLKRTGR